MGEFTTLALNCSLRHDTPQEVIDTLRWYCFRTGKSDNVLFKTTSGKSPLGGFRNGCLHYAMMEFEQNSWDISARIAIKNYQGEIEQFLEWLRPYVAEGVGLNDMYAITMHEYNETPTIYYLKDTYETNTTRK